jgi:hypothetical protein
MEICVVLKHLCGRKLIASVLFFTLSLGAYGQSTDSQNSGKSKSTTSAPNQKKKSSRPQQQSYPATAAPVGLVKNLVRDQKDIWTSPFKARVQDLNWILPIVGLTAGMINADAELSSRINPKGTFSSHSGTISNGGLGFAVAGSGALWLIGRWRADDHQQEAGILAGEAAVNSFLVDEVFKFTTQRERPTDGTGQGRFWHGTTANSSFPSNHSIITWSIASVIAHEYPGPLTKFFAYGLATGVSIARVTGRNHFPSDVIAGSAMGWLIGRQVYSRHHDSDLTDLGYGTFVKDKTPEVGLGALSKDISPEIGISSSDSIASPYVPMDSWVYPAFDRLSSFGVIPSGMLGLRPWTRRECARLLEESTGYVDDIEPDEATRLLAVLNQEFATELHGTETNYIGIDSVYARVTGISGKPLTDGYHFGKTIVNDYGRPYQAGGNFLGGFSSSASIGPLGFYVRGEFEHAPSAPGVSQAVQDVLQIADQKPVVQPASPIAAFNKLRLLDSYVMLNLKGWQMSFGKQTLWLGPTRDPFLWSNNAEPTYMFRVDQTSPRKLPSFLGKLGPYRVEFWVGKLTGQHFVSTQDPAVGNVFSIGRSLERQPMVNGQKINFRPTPNLEFGVGKTGLWGGPDFPITAGTVKHSLFSTSNTVGRGNDPGDRRSTFDFSYRIPGFRKWLTLYEDSFVEDEVSPIGYPRRAAHNPGIYMPQLPKLPHMDFRVEASYTNLPGLIEPPAGGFFYWNTRYQDGYTNKGDIVGNGTVGRQGIAFRAESTYWFASDKTIQLGYRTMVADPMFAKGGAFRDTYVHSEWKFNPGVSLSSFLQYEWWNFPLLTNGNRQNDFTASFQLTYWPHWRLRSGK